MPYATIILLLASFIFATPAHAASKATCPEKTLDTLTVEGTYLGWFEGEDWNSIGVKINGEDAYFTATEENAIKYFGNSTGKRVVATYELQQFFIEADEGLCMRLEVFKSGKVLDFQHTEKNMAIAGKYILQVEGYTGNMSITDANNGNDECVVDIVGVYNESLKTDGMDDILCKRSKNKILCPSIQTPALDPDANEGEFVFEILVENDRATVSNFQGSRVINADGVYIKQ